MAGNCMQDLLPTDQDENLPLITIPFIRGKNNVSLSKGLKYCIQFKVSLAESSKYACNNIGAYFTKEAPSSNLGIINAPEKSD